MLNDVHLDRMFENPVVAVAEHVPIRLQRLKTSLRVLRPGHNELFSLFRSLPYELPLPPRIRLTGAEEAGRAPSVPPIERYVHSFNLSSRSPESIHSKDLM